MTFTDDQYLDTIGALTTAARALLGLAEFIDIRQLRTIVGQMEAIAPIVEPTAYARGGRQNLADQAEFLAAVDEFVTRVRRLDRRCGESDQQHSAAVVQAAEPPAGASEGDQSSPGSSEALRAVQPLPESRARRILREMTQDAVEAGSYGQPTPELARPREAP